MVNRETFSRIRQHTLWHLVQEHSVHGIKQLREEFLCMKARRNPWLEWVIRTGTHFRHRDSYEVRQPETHSTQRRGEITGIISELHFDMFPAPQTFSCWKIRFKTEVCSCSHFLAEALLWIKEVELVNSVDDLKSSRSVQGTNFTDLELFDARIASALNKLWKNSHFRKRVILEELKAPKTRPIPSRKTDCLLDLWLLLGRWRQRFCTWLCPHIYGCSSEWQTFRNLTQDWTKFS